MATAKRQTGEFVFDINHDTSIVLSNSNLTATCTKGSIHSIVLSCDPIEEDVLYEVRVDKWPTSVWMTGMRVGVLPELHTLPLWNYVLRPASFVRPGGVKLTGADGWVYNPVSSAMAGLGQGQRVGVSLDASRQVHLHVDGKDRGVWDTVDNGRCHVIIDLFGFKIQVTALPPTPLDS